MPSPMRKTFVGPRLRQLRRDRGQTQAEMAKALGVSPTYVNLLENNQRSLSVQVLMSISDVYQVDWRDLVSDEGSSKLADLRMALRDQIFGDAAPDLTEVRAAIDHAPGLVDSFLTLYQSHRRTVDRLMRTGEGQAQMPSNLMSSSPETIIHDFFRNNENHFPTLERAAEQLRANDPCEPDEVYSMLKRRLLDKHGLRLRIRPIEQMGRALRVHEASEEELHLSEALDHKNRVFQLAHVLCFIEFEDLLDEAMAGSGIQSQTGLARCKVELANYFAAAFLMPYGAFLATANRTLYDVDRIAAAFGVSFEQVCHRLTTLQRPGSPGVPFFFLRVDKAGNVTKRFNATSFTLAEYGGACPVWNIHTAFRTPGVILPQFVELPDGERFFTICRTTDRPVFSQDTQDRRLLIALGCAAEHQAKIGYAKKFNTEMENIFSPIGINCPLCPRQACSQRAHQPLVVDLQLDTSRRGNTRYES